MPTATDDLDLELDGNDEGDEGDAGDAGDGGEGEPKEPKSGEEEGKRVRDLQSARDKETARANKAEAALAKALARGEGSDKGSDDPETAALMQELREASLDAVYGEFEQLREYGIDRTLIEGRTRAEMRESATSLVGLIKSVETKARNKTLREHGIKAEPAGANRQPPKDYSSMSDEEFEKEMARNRSGGPTIW